MLVDDEEEVLDSLSRLLTRMEYRVDSFQYPARALERFANNPDDFDLVITDHSMPDMSGSVLLQEIRNLRKDIPVVLCTGFSDFLKSRQLQSQGFDAAIPKPFTMMEVSDTLGRVFDPDEARIDPSDPQS